MEGYAERTILVERDPYVASVWQAVLSADAERLVDQILNFRLSRRAVSEVLAARPRTNLSLAFQTIVKNRCRRGGILSDSAGLLVRGERDRGLHSRWYPDTLALRIALIHEHRDQIEFRRGDGLRFINRMKSRLSSVRFFVDPPYPKLMKKGVRPLYNHCAVNHEKLMEALKEMRHDFLLTYDDTPYARQLARGAAFPWRTVLVRNNNGASKKELLIGRVDNSTFF
jgi:DNA adenine methylase